MINNSHAGVQVANDNCWVTEDDYVLDEWSFVRYGLLESYFIQVLLH